MSVSCGEDKDFVVIRLHEGVVPVGKVSVEHLEADVLTQFHLLQQWDAVKNLSVKALVDEQGGIAVVEELHVTEHIERPAVKLYEVREVGLWGEEHRERHFVPLVSALQICLDGTACTGNQNFLKMVASVML